MKSRAAIHIKTNQQLLIDDIDIPDPKTDYVNLKMFSSGICHSQLHQMNNPEFQTPALLGHEGTGIVTDIGKNVTHLKEGDLAIVTWVPRNPIEGRWAPDPGGMTWKEAPLEGSTATWCEDVSVWSGYVVKINDEDPKDISSIVGCAVLTGAGAVLNTAKVRPNQSVAVFGVGGVGMCALKMASILEADPLIAVDIDDSKLEFAKQFGATHVINSKKNDPIEGIHEITSGGADFAFDAIGLKITNEQILPSVRSGGPGANNVGGMAVLIGMPGKEMTVDPGHFMFHQRQYRGSLGATYPDKDFNMFLRWHKQGKFPLDQLVTKRYKLDQINEACEDLKNGKILGRAIMEY